MKCEICGKEIEKSSYIGNVLCSSECFTKNYWLERVKRKDVPTQVVIGGQVFQIASEDSDRGVRGFGGRRFVIEFFDGRKVITTNLWINATIPEEFIEQLPDNARWGK